NVEIRQRLSAMQLQNGHVDEALKTLEPTDADPRLFRQKVQMLILTNRFDDAEKTVKSGLEKTPDSAELNGILMTIYAQTRQFPKAMELAEKTLARDPMNVAALYNRGFMRMQQAKPDLNGALEDLQKVKDRDPNHVDARFWLAAVYRERNEWDRAIRELDGALQLAPNNGRLRAK